MERPRGQHGMREGHQHAINEGHQHAASMQSVAISMQSVAISIQISIQISMQSVAFTPARELAASILGSQSPRALGQGLGGGVGLRPSCSRPVGRPAAPRATAGSISSVGTRTRARYGAWLRTRRTHRAVNVPRAVNVHRARPSASCQRRAQRECSPQRACCRRRSNPPDWSLGTPPRRGSMRPHRRV